MFKALVPLAAALFAVAAPAAAQRGDPPLDTRCPQGDLNAPRGPGSVCIGRLTEDYAFSFIYPREAAAIPRLDALLRDEALRAEVRFERQAAEFRANHPTENPPRSSYEAEWHMDARLPELIAMSTAIGTYTGGAHGGIAYRTLLFDPRRNRRIGLDDIFTIGALEHDLLGQRPVGMGAVQSAFCRALNAEVRERRSGTVQIDCPSVERIPLTMICGERNRIESMRALVAPYIVGSWAEGPYEVDFPVDAMMMAAIKRRYRPAFGVALEGRTRRLRAPCR